MKIYNKNLLFGILTLTYKAYSNLLFMLFSSVEITNIQVDMISNLYTSNNISKTRKFLVTL